MSGTAICKNCKHFRKLNAIDGECKLYPPQLGLWQNNNDPITYITIPMIVPVTLEDYCGQFDRDTAAIKEREARSAKRKPK